MMVCSLLCGSFLLRLVERGVEEAPPRRIFFLSLPVVPFVARVARVRFCRAARQPASRGAFFLEKGRIRYSLSPSRDKK
jgi:hypothetical protein